VSIITGHNVFMLFIWLVFAWFLVAIPYLLVMHFLMPRSILDRYFRPPYFREFECHLFTGIPYAPMRTIMFMGVIVFPRLGKKRKMTSVYLDAPRWYQIASKAWFYIIFVIAGGAITSLIGLVVYTAFTESTA